MRSLNLIQQQRILFYYFLLSYFVTLFIASESVNFAKAYASGWEATLFILIAFLCYGALYLLPSILITWLVLFLSNLGRRSNIPCRAIPACMSAIVTTGSTQLLLFANAKIFSLYGMFINGFIINLVMTPGGIESLGGSTASEAGFAMIAASFYTLQGLILWSACKIYQCKAKGPAPHTLPKVPFLHASIALLISSVCVHFSYAASEAFNRHTIAMAAETVPFFQPVSARHFFRKIGFQVEERKTMDIPGRLAYPLHSLNITHPVKPLNIIWLAAESWRADMLDAGIMPATWEFAAQSDRFTRNYSGGNGTRNGIFTMFTGIPGNYWFKFIKEQRGAAIIDVLQKEGYQMELFTSARFSYPEFDKTIFSKIPADKMHSLDTGGEGWERDRKNVSRLLDFIEKRDPAKPFFTFMFFESPHARYYFPPESIIRRPYRDDINYATLDKEELRRDIVPIKNRYINAVHHLDSQFARVFSYLKEKNLLDSTIVILVGDHGEEFMEHGYWGHNSTFVDQQVRTPLVIRVPGKPARTDDRMTSHMDIIPTIMPLLGVTNPASDYATGYNLMGEARRTHTYISDWSRIVYVDNDVKIAQPISIQGYAGRQVTSAGDQAVPLEQEGKILRKKQPKMLQMVQDLSKFLERHSNKIASK